MACERVEYDFPRVPVNFTIFLNEPDFVDLNAVGNHVMVTGGYKGIILYRKSFDEFAAFERACPHDHEHAWGKVASLNSFVVADTVCGSQFSLPSDGSVLEGPAQLPLWTYRTFYDPVARTLRVTN